MSSSSTDDFPQMQEIILEFRAGKMHFEGKKVVPDPRKGLVRIAKGEEGLVHFQWLDRTQNAVENEPKAEDDSQLCSSVNYYINRPLKFPGDEEPDSSDPLQVSEDMNEDEISSRAGALIGSNLSAEGISEVTTSSSGPVKLEDLQRILSNIEPSGVAEDLDEGFGLGDMFRPDLIMPFFETLPLEQRLACYLPEGQWSPEYILELLQSPQFRQQVDSFTYVLRTGQIDLSQFEIDPSKYKFTVLSFLEALEDSVSNMSDSGEATQENEDLRSQSCNPNDTMDKSQ